MLCSDFVEEIQSKLNVPMGDYSSFGRLFEHLMILSKERPFNLIIDEFQDFIRINPAVFSEMQKHWDLNKKTSKMNLLVSGSIYSLMHKIFEDKKEPLFSRAGQIINLKPFTVSVLREILSDHHPDCTHEDLLALYTFSGGVAWYVELFMKYRAFTRDEMIRLISEENSPFLNEGKNLLIEESGKDYTIYFSILECIARGLTTRGDIENYLGQIEIGGYLSRLERDFSIVSQQRPIFAKPSSKQVRYFIEDNFISFWFRFIYKYQNFIESGSYQLLENIIRRDYNVFSGITLERYFKAKYKESGQYTNLGGFWDRKGENEIDLIAINELDRTVEFVEIKRNPSRIDLNVLESKAACFLQNTGECKGYNITYKGLSLENM
jgi:AAA+ ATPase superfamily predicted ATPase